ncbi:beta-hexosaminidase-like [Pecten maximus]|uniref:beta-hexosaminidase-like n=1 Tax=Pecten maximus TaxID=6579 RepID=UPI001458FC9B|nr:beta-hexosaminidase-like [Pecten maximus]
MDQSSLDSIANNLDIKYQVTDNVAARKSYIAKVILTNTGDVPLKGNGKWAIYFCHIRMVEPLTLPDADQICMEKYGVKFCHINGCLFTLEPLKSFKTLKKNDSLEITFTAEYYSVARSDLMPNWYITCKDLIPRIIQSTQGEDLNYILPFDTPESWKRHKWDKYDPFSQEVRYEKNHVDDLGKAGSLVTPIPYRLTVVSDGTLDLSKQSWCIVANQEVMEEAQFLKEKSDSIKLNLQNNQDLKLEQNHVIVLKIGPVTVNSEECKESDKLDAYELIVKLEEEVIEVIGSSAVGVFYGVQTVLSLLEGCEVPHVHILDFPRYSYRGMHLDVSRNFHKKESVLKLLEVMAMYKMNKFHFHLTDDEGWRLEIPGLEELTSVGSRRGHDLEEKTCILPMLGSGPNFDTSGSGYYSVEDYKEILQFAKRRHIEVIPEIDMPGHSHAAIKAMQARYCRFQEVNDVESAREYLLTDFHDSESVTTSVQMYSENSMNPGLDSTYKFVDKIVKEVKDMHAEIMPLKTFHFGGDEVPYKAWKKSAACEKLIENGDVESFDKLMEHFVKRLAEVVAKHDLSLGAWQDGLIHSGITPVERTKFPNEEVLAYAWQNVWESGLAGFAYKLANAGYKVVMSQATHLYFDHPYEPDPEEVGLYWATRYIDTRKTFNFMPDNIFANADVKLTGKALSREDIEKCNEDNDILTEKQNVIGMQGQLWSELVRTSDVLDSMIHPRLQALAERAWHKAPWEEIGDVNKLKKDQTADWTMFSNSLGYKELRRLDKMGVAYHIPPPGARVEGDKLHVISAYPGLPLCYSTDNGTTWLDVEESVQVKPGDKIIIVCKSADKLRSSRRMTLTVPGASLSK